MAHSHCDHQHAQVTYPPPVTAYPPPGHQIYPPPGQAYPAPDHSYPLQPAMQAIQGPHVAAAAPPPPAGYPTYQGGPGYPHQVPVETKSRGDGFWKGCLAALCCCCVLETCCV